MSQVFKLVFIYFGAILKTTSAGSCASGPAGAGATRTAATRAGKISTTAAAAGKISAAKNIQKSFKFIHIYFGSILKTMSAGSCASPSRLRHPKTLAAILSPARKIHPKTLAMQAAANLNTFKHLGKKTYKFIHIYFGAILKTTSAGSCASGPATRATIAAISQIVLNDAVYSIPPYHKIKQFINTFLTPPQGLAMT